MIRFDDIVTWVIQDLFRLQRNAHGREVGYSTSSRLDTSCNRKFWKDQVHFCCYDLSIAVVNLPANLSSWVTELRERLAGTWTTTGFSSECRLSMVIQNSANSFCNRRVLSASLRSMLHRVEDCEQHPPIAKRPCEAPLSLSALVTLKVRPPHGFPSTTSSTSQPSPANSQDRSCFLPMKAHYQAPFGEALPASNLHQQSEMQVKEYKVHFWGSLRGNLQCIMTGMQEQVHHQHHQLAGLKKEWPMRSTASPESVWRHLFTLKGSQPCITTWLPSATTWSFAEVDSWNQFRQPKRREEDSTCCFWGGVVDAGSLPGTISRCVKRSKQKPTPRTKKHISTCRSVFYQVWRFRYHSQHLATTIRHHQNFCSVWSEQLWMQDQVHPAKLLPLHPLGHLDTVCPMHGVRLHCWRCRHV